MLTPRDLEQVRFRRVFRGLDPDEVDEFVRRLIREYETLANEYRRLQRQVGGEGSSSGHSPPLGSVPVPADEQAEALLAQARQEAEALLARAREEAETIRQKAQADLQAQWARLVALREQERQCRERLEQLLEQARQMATQLTAVTTALDEVRAGWAEAAAALRASDVAHDPRVSAEGYGTDHA